MTASRQEQLAAAYAQMFNPASREGQLVLDDLLDAAGVADAPAPGEADNGLGLAWREGRRSMGIFLMRRLSLSASEIALMQRRRALDMVHPGEAA